MAHIHSVYDTDKHFSINPITRAIKNEASTKTCVIQYDHNSERFTFEIPRTVEDHDMSLCNVVQVHYININPQTKERKTGVYEVDDLQISPEGDDVVILSWLISQNATQLVGSLNFLIRFVCTTDGNLDYAWNTAIYTGISVSSGIYNGDVIVEEYADILAQWEERITALELGGNTVKTVNGIEPDENGNVEIETGNPVESDPTVFDWAKKELFNKADLTGSIDSDPFKTIDGVEYYRYHAGSSYGFTWNNPDPKPGAVTITARGVSQYGGTNGTRLKTIYDDGTYGPDIYIIVSGESRTVTVTTDASKTLAKITGNYDMENWVLLDMSVMSIQANYNRGLPVADANAAGGVLADPATDADTIPARVKDGRLFVAGATDAQIADVVNAYLADNPISGDSGYRVIATYETVEETSQIEVTEDMDGNPFSLKSVVAVLDQLTDDTSREINYFMFYANSIAVDTYVQPYFSKYKYVYWALKTDGDLLTTTEIATTEDGNIRVSTPDAITKRYATPDGLKNGIASIRIATLDTMRVVGTKITIYGK